MEKRVIKKVTDINLGFYFEGKLFVNSVDYNIQIALCLINN